jgi:urate oxidase
MMPGRLKQDFYGKSDIRVSKVIRHKSRHDLVEMSVDVILSGDFAESYLTGNNRKIVATDSMKNTVYVLAKRHPLDSIESFGMDLARHFLRTYPQVRRANVQIRQLSWQRIAVGGRPHPHAFRCGGSEMRTCGIGAVAGQSPVLVRSGLSDLMILKTTDSAFKGFVRDRYTTLPETGDRIFATSINAGWIYSRNDIDFNKAFANTRTALLETFARHKSLSVQQTLYAMGQTAMRRCKMISSIYITMPNKHRVLVNLQPFGIEKNKEVFVWTDEPYGNIFGSLERG